MTAVGLRELLAGDKLTGRELDVLRYAACGMTAKETARALGLAVETVKFHRKHAIAKLDAANITHAVALSARRGLVDLAAV